jgi:hypothetical protein
MNFVIVIVIIVTLIITIYICTKRCFIRKNKFFTITMSDYSKIPDNTDKQCAGLYHVQSCLIKLIKTSKYLGRRAVLPPPWLYLDKKHNDGNSVDIDVWWDRYFDLSKLEKEGIIEPCNGIVKHLNKPVRGLIYSLVTDDIKYFEPDTKISLLPTNVDVVVITYYQKSSKIHHYSCMGIEEENNKYFEPSEGVKDISKKIRYTIGEYNTIHVRRGDVITSNGKYSGYNVSEIDKKTQPEYIMSFLKRNNISKETPLLLFTNEKDEHFFDLLKQSYNIIIEKDIIELSNVKTQTGDNFYVYEICRDLCRHSIIDISTVVPRIGPGHLRLVS